MVFGSDAGHERQWHTVVLLPPRELLKQGDGGMDTPFRASTKVVARQSTTMRNGALLPQFLGRMDSLSRKNSDSPTFQVRGAPEGFKRDSCFWNEVEGGSVLEK